MRITSFCGPLDWPCASCAMMSSCMRAASGAASGVAYCVRSRCLSRPREYREENPMQIIRQADFREGRWRNGMGVSWDIASDPPGAEDFGWRLALAQIDADVPFSLYPGVDRIFVLVEGNGLSLEFEGRPSLLVGKPLRSPPISLRRAHLLPPAQGSLPRAEPVHIPQPMAGHCGGLVLAALRSRTMARSFSLRFQARRTSMARPWGRAMRPSPQAA